MVGRVVDKGWSLAGAAEAAGVSERTARSGWRAIAGRARRAFGIALGAGEGAGPHAEDRVQAMRRWAVADDRGGDRGGAVDAALDGVGDPSPDRARQALAARASRAAQRYERSLPGELVHVDVKKLARFHRPGHRMLGRGPGRYERARGGLRLRARLRRDYSRLAYVEVLTNERATTAIAFLGRAIGWFAQHGVRVQAVMSDNGAAYRSTLHKVACIALGIRHLRTAHAGRAPTAKPSASSRHCSAAGPTARIYRNSRERNRALSGWLTHYNYTRRHGSLGHKPPSSRLNNQARNYTSRPTDPARSPR